MVTANLHQSNVTKLNENDFLFCITITLTQVNVVLNWNFTKNVLKHSNLGGNKHARFLITIIILFSLTIN